MAASRIDTHHHVVPPFYRDWLIARGMDAGGLPMPTWAESDALQLMDMQHVRTAILSVSTPGVHLGDDGEAREMARRVNEFAAELKQRRPERFGFFATLTLPDVEGAIAEAAYALEKLGADGVVLLANVQGMYLGCAKWMPLMEALDARAARVFVHPSTLPCEPVPGIPPFAADFLLDTTRAALNLAKSGALERFPNLRIILSHAGGFVPFAAERMARICSEDGGIDGGLARLRRFYFDTALSSSPYALPSLLAFADPKRITYGSDWPYANTKRSCHFSQLLDAYELEPSLRDAIHRGNAQALFPRLAN
ncbi:MAG: amidohydrolase family protein [Burkholderiaceae bacterium]